MHAQEPDSATRTARVAKFEILLDEQDGDLALGAQIGDGAADILDDRGLDALGRLVEHEEPRPRDEGAADGELLLLAAGEVAAAPAAAWSSAPGKSSKTSSGILRSRAAGAKPVSRFSFTVRSGKISRPCGT